MHCNIIEARIIPCFNVLWLIIPRVSALQIPLKNVGTKNHKKWSSVLYAESVQQSQHRTQKGVEFMWKVFFTTWSRFKDLGLLPVSSSLFYHILLSVQTSAKSLFQPCQILTMYMTLNLTESWIQMTVLGQCAWLINLLYLLYFKNTVPALRPLCSVLVYVQTVQMKTLASLSAYDDSMTVHAVWNMKPCIFYFLVKNLTCIPNIPALQWLV